jgi:hypothetical protein
MYDVLSAAGIRNALVHRHLPPELLRRIESRDPSLAGLGCSVLARALSLNSCITRLNLEGSDVGPVGCAILFPALTHLTTLTYLNLKNTLIHPPLDDCARLPVCRNAQNRYVGFASCHPDFDEAVRAAKDGSRKILLRGNYKANHNQYLISDNQTRRLIESLSSLSGITDVDLSSKKHHCWKCSDNGDAMLYLHIFCTSLTNRLLQKTTSKNLDA